MSVLRLSDRDLRDAEKVSDGVDFSERDSGLSHSPRAGVHAKKNNPRFLRTQRHILTESLPRIAQRVVDVRDRPSEPQRVNLITELHIEIKNV